MNLYAHFSAPASTDASRLTKMAAAAGLMVCALLLRAMADVEPTAIAASLLFYGALVMVACGGVLALLLCLPFKAFANEKDAALLYRWGMRMSRPAALFATMALVIALDMGSAAWFRTAQVADTSVIRTACSRISSSKVKVTINSDEWDGQWCFQRAGARNSDGTVWRVDTDLVKPSLVVGQQAMMRLNTYGSFLFGPSAYTRAQQVS